MSKQTWQGPFNNPFQAAVKALAANNIDTSEFSGFGMWAMCGEYDFFNQEDKFLGDLIDFIGEHHSIVIQQLSDGFWASYKEADVEPSGVYDLKCVDDPDTMTKKHAVTFNDGVIAEFISFDDAVAFKRMKES